MIQGRDCRRRGRGGLRLHQLGIGCNDVTLIGHGIPHIDPHRHIGNIEQSAPQYDASYYRQAHNLKVAGSNPAPATKPIGTPVWTPAGVPFLFSTVKLPYRCSPPPQHHLQPSAAETPPNLRRLPQPPPKTLLICLHALPVSETRPRQPDDLACPSHAQPKAPDHVPDRFPPRLGL